MQTEAAQLSPRLEKDLLPGVRLPLVRISGSIILLVCLVSTWFVEAVTTTIYLEHALGDKSAFLGSSPWTSGSHLLDQGKTNCFFFLPAGNPLARHLVTSLQSIHGVGMAAGPTLC